MPTDDAIYDIQLAGQAYLAEQGYQGYEISAYSQPNRQANHNLNYWQFGDYLGIGAGAHGKITLAEESQIIRTRKTRQPNHYLDQSRPFNVSTTPIATAELSLEFMMNAMRLCAGSDIASFESRTGLSIENITKPLSQLRIKGLIDEHHLKPTSKGLLYLNDLLEHFV